MLITFTFPETVEQTRLSATFDSDKIQYISSPEGKRLSHDRSEIQFGGYTVISEGFKKTIQAISSVTAASGAISSTSTGIVVASSLFSNSLSFLSKMIQIMEFTAFMELYNVNFDPILGNVLRFIAEATEVELMAVPSENMYQKLDHGKAGIFKGKLSEIGIKPYLIQNIGYPGLLLVVIYLVNFCLDLFTNKKYKKLEMIRYSLFSTLFIDYLGIVLRTLGHHPARTQSDANSKLSFFLSIFFVIGFTVEMTQFYLKADSLYLKKKRDKDEIDRLYEGYLYEGLRKSSLKKSYFCRMYNFFFMLRFFVVIIFIFNAQWQQIFQVLASLVVQVYFTFASLYYSRKYNFFNSKFTRFFRLTQEVSMCFIVLLINVFYYDNNFGALTQKTKLTLVILFIVLICVNILLEILNAIVGTLVMFGCIKNSGQEVSRKVKNKLEILDEVPSSAHAKQKTDRKSSSNIRTPMTDKRKSSGKKEKVIFKKKKIKSGRSKKEKLTVENQLIEKKLKRKKSTHRKRNKMPQYSKKSSNEQLISPSELNRTDKEKTRQMKKAHRKKNKLSIEDNKYSVGAPVSKKGSMESPQSDLQSPAISSSMRLRSKFSPFNLDKKQLENSTFSSMALKRLVQNQGSPQKRVSIQLKNRGSILQSPIMKARAQLNNNGSPSKKRVVNLRKLSLFQQARPEYSKNSVRNSMTPSNRKSSFNRTPDEGSMFIRRRAQSSTFNLKELNGSKQTDSNKQVGKKRSHFGKKQTNNLLKE